MAKIMIIDDEPDFRTIVKLALEEKEHEVLAAESGEEGLEMLEKEVPDLILLDINMPGLDGWQTLKEMRRRGITERVPVMMFTVEDLTFVKMLREEMEGLVGYLEKPIGMAELIEATRSKINEVHEIRKRAEMIRESPESGEELASAYEAWTRAMMIHERFLEKLCEMEEKITDEDRHARIANLKKGEKNTIDYLGRKGNEVLRSVGLENFIQEK